MGEARRQRDVFQPSMGNILRRRGKDVRLREEKRRGGGGDLLLGKGYTAETTP